MANVKLNPFLDDSVVKCVCYWSWNIHTKKLKCWNISFCLLHSGPINVLFKGNALPFFTISCNPFHWAGGGGGRWGGVEKCWLWSNSSWQGSIIGPQVILLPFLNKMSSEYLLAGRMLSIHYIIETRQANWHKIDHGDEWEGCWWWWGEGGEGPVEQPLRLLHILSWLRRRFR